MNTSFNKEENYQDILNSPEFKKLDILVSQSNARLTELPDESRRLALMMLANGDTKAISGIEDILFRRHLPTFEEFLADPIYLAGSGETVFPYWKKEFSEFFDPRSRRYESVLTGAIGVGKSSVARYCIIYNMIRVACLREPQLTLGMTRETPLIHLLMTLTLDKAWDTLAQPIYHIMKAGDIFEQVKYREDIDFYKGDKIPFMLIGGNKTPSGIEMANMMKLSMASEEGHSLSTCLVSAVFDEAEFTGKDVEVVVSQYQQLRNRISARLKDPVTGYLPKYAFMSLVSSSKGQGGIISQFAAEIKPDDPYSVVLGKSIWETKSLNPYDRGYFYVLRGTSRYKSRILDAEHAEIESGVWKTPSGCEVIKVPESYRAQFKFRIEKSLQELAGVTTVGNDHPFDDVESAYDEKLLPEFELSAPLGGLTPLVEKIPRDIFVMTPEGWRLRRLPNAPRYLHADLTSVSGSEMGLSLVHKELGPNNEIFYVTDFVLYGTTPNRIDLNGVTKMIRDLATKYGVKLHTVSADMHQSEAMRQELLLSKEIENVKYQSIDRYPETYYSLASLIVAGQFKIGRCDKLRDQLESLVVVKDKVVTTKKKDMADSIAGSVENARRNVKDIPTVYYGRDAFDVTKLEDLEDI